MAIERYRQIVISARAPSSLIVILAHLAGSDEGVAADVAIFDF
jgi:hypothetical protein